MEKMGDTDYKNIAKYNGKCTTFSIMQISFVYKI